MQFQCPSCKRTFEETGFCPFDRSQLVDPTAAGTIIPLTPSDQQTILSMAMKAQSAPDSTNPPTSEMRRETFPLTPTPKPNQVTQEVTATRARVQTPSEQPRFRAVSATDSEADALEAMRMQRGDSEYDRLVGQTLDGRYYVEKKIGEGGMGVVFSARHAVIERPLAIKVLKREVMRDTATIQRFVREAKAASRIGHPNIVDVTDFGTTPDGMTYSVMEYVTGDTLGAALRAAAPFPPQRAVKIAAQIARALGAAHDKGIVHRDLKPENVFLINRDGRTDFVKIVDFGIAKVAPTSGANEPRLTRAGSVFGTPEYMAPEQAAGRGDADGRVDIYALGIILYEMITGRVPHRGDSMVRTLAMQMLDPVEPPTKVRPDLPIPPELEQVILMALAKKREQRYQTMGELLVALEKVLTLVGQSVTGSPIYALSPLPPGADPNTVTNATAPHAQKTQVKIVPSTPTAKPATETGSTTRRPKSRTAPHEPQFTAGDKPRTFEHVWTESDLPAPRKRWPLVMLLLLVVGGGATAFGLLYVKRNEGEAPPVARDAGLAIVPVAPDAEVVTPPVDAEVVVLADAGVVDATTTTPPRDAKEDIVVIQAPDGGLHKKVDAGLATNVVVETPNQRGTIMIQVLTKPEGATLYAGTSYRGPGGATLEEPYGAHLDIRCTQKGYKEGKVELVFDGKTEVALCVLTRIKICIDNVKNPFDDCELAPNP